MSPLRIKTTGQINTRTQDGRDVTADEGTVLDIDPEDAVLVGFARSLIMSGQATHYGDAGGVEEEVTASTFEEETGANDPVAVDLAHDDESDDVIDAKD